MAATEDVLRNPILTDDKLDSSRGTGHKSVPDGNYLKHELYELVRKDETIFDFLQNGSLDGIFYWDVEHPENEYMSARFWKVLGYDPDEKAHLAGEWQKLINEDDLALALKNFRKHCEDPGHPYDQVVRYRHRNGSTVWMRCRGIAIRDEHGKVTRMLGAHNDVTAIVEVRKKLKEIDELRVINRSLQEMVIRDPLTRLYNRRGLLQHFNYIEKLSVRSQEPFSLIMLDIDHFKRFNDAHGHRVGDGILVGVARLMRKFCREVDIVARLGGEEFCIVAPDTGADSAILLCERLRAALAGHRFNELQVTASFGISTCEPHAADVSDLYSRMVRDADRAMYAVKRSGRNAVLHFGNLPPSGIDST